MFFVRTVLIISEHGSWENPLWFQSPPMNRILTKTTSWKDIESVINHTIFFTLHDFQQRYGWIEHMWREYSKRIHSILLISNRTYIYISKFNIITHLPKILSLQWIFNGYGFFNITLFDIVEQITQIIWIKSYGIYCVHQHHPYLCDRFFCITSYYHFLLHINMY